MKHYAASTMLLPHLVHLVPSQAILQHPMPSSRPCLWKPRMGLAASIRVDFGVEGLGLPGALRHRPGQGVMEQMVLLRSGLVGLQHDCRSWRGHLSATRSFWHVFGPGGPRPAFRVRRSMAMTPQFVNGLAVTAVDLSPKPECCPSYYKTLPSSQGQGKPQTPMYPHVPSVSLCKIARLIGYLEGLRRHLAACIWEPFS